MRPAAIALLPLASLAWALGCSVRDAPRPNLLLISVDTLRADHLGCYGYERATSPVIDALAARATRYARAFAPSPWTLPSHVAVLTGRHPARLGVHGIHSALADGVGVVAEPLLAAGYQTAAFVDSAPDGFVGAERGLSRGFESYRHAPHAASGSRSYDAGETVEAVVAWLEARERGRPFFLFVHSKAVHSLREDESRSVPGASPYDAPEPFRWRFRPSQQPGTVWRSPSGSSGVRVLQQLNRSLALGHMRGEKLRPSASDLVVRYDAAIAYLDHQLGVLFDALVRGRLADDTAVVLLSDHGEGFLDHRFFLHKELHREILQVPLLVQRPGQRVGNVVATPVGLEDVAPTLLALAGLPIPAEMSGAPLPAADAALAADGEPRRLFAAARRGSDDVYEGASLREGDWVLIRDRLAGEQAFALRLYDVGSDAAEQAPVAGQEERKARMARELLGWLEASEPAVTRDIELLPQTLEELQALGYVE